MARQGLTNETERKYSRSISLTVKEFGDIENYGLGSLSAGASELLKRHETLLIQHTELQNHLKQLNGKK